MEHIHKIILNINNEIESARTMNKMRARWADAALTTFIDVTGTDREDALPDLLCDLMHLAAEEDHLGNFEEALDKAQKHFESETFDREASEVL